MKKILLLITISLAYSALGMESSEYNKLGEGLVHLKNINSAIYIKDIKNLLNTSPSSVTLYEKLLKETRQLESVLSSQSSQFPEARLKDLEDIRTEVKKMPQDMNSAISQFLPISKELSNFLKAEIEKMDRFIISCGFTPVAMCKAYDLEKNQQIFLGSKIGLFVWDLSTRRMKKLASDPIVNIWCDTSCNKPIIYSYDGKNTSKWEWIQTFFGSFTLQATKAENGQGDNIMHSNSRLVIGKDIILDLSNSKLILKYKIDEIFNKLYNFKTLDQSLFFHILGQYKAIQKKKNKKLILDPTKSESKELRSTFASLDPSVQDALRGSLVIDNQFDQYKHEIVPFVKKGCMFCIGTYLAMVSGSIVMLSIIFS